MAEVEVLDGRWRKRERERGGRGRVFMSAGKEPCVTLGQLRSEGEAKAR
jgi:hypothetical protein